MTKTERDAQLTALKEAVDTFTEEEASRLKTERDFLQSILDNNSADAALVRSRLSDEVVAIESVRALVGIA